MNARLIETLYWMSVLLAFALLTMIFPQRAAADDNDPPGRVARLNYPRVSVSFRPAGESNWILAVVNRPMTTGNILQARSRANNNGNYRTYRNQARQISA